ncbi:MAG: hypothetical protein ACXWLQ_00785 [Rhizomicrobium sp.]
MNKHKIGRWLAIGGVVAVAGFALAAIYFIYLFHHRPEFPNAVLDQTVALRQRNRRFFVTPTEAATFYSVLFGSWGAGMVSGVVSWSMGDSRPPLPNWYPQFVFLAIMSVIAFAVLSALWQ